MNAKQYHEQRTPEKLFFFPILMVLAELGGREGMPFVLERVERQMREQLTRLDYEFLPKNSQLRWRNTACWARKRLIEQGLLKANSLRGIWEITDKGREYLKH